jgi:hypothetical protein
MSGAPSSTTSATGSARPPACESDGTSLEVQAETDTGAVDAEGVSAEATVEEAVEAQAAVEAEETAEAPAEAAAEPEAGAETADDAATDDEPEAAGEADRSS